MSGREGSSGELSVDMQALSREGLYFPSRQALWLSLSNPLTNRHDGTWLAGVALFLILAGVLPLTFLAMSLFSMLAVATCLRAYALHEYTRQLTELAIQEQADLEDGEPEEGASGTTPGSATGGAGARRRGPGSRSGGAGRSGAASLFSAVVAGRRVNLLNLRLSMLDRDFTDRDYDLLMRLDELEAAQPQEPENPVPESQLALLPVHVHRSPAKKAKQPKQLPEKGKGQQADKGKGQQAGAGFGSGGISFGAPATPQRLDTSAGRPAESPAATPRPPAYRPRCVPVLVEQLQPLQQQQTTAARGTAWWGGGGGGGGGARGPGRQPSATLGAGAGQEIVPVAPASESEGEDDDAPLCSVCLEPFADGAKILSLPCRHQYHADCVTQWLRLKGMAATCPNCKGIVFKQEGEAA